MLRKSLCPRPPAASVVEKLTEVIAQIEDAFETDSPTDELMLTHNKLAIRKDIEASRYQKLYSSMSCEEAAHEALMPLPVKVNDITRHELEDIASRIITPKAHHETSYFLNLFELNTPSGSSDLFFWPDKTWLLKLETDSPSPAQIVDKALEHDSKI